MLDLGQRGSLIAAVAVGAVVGLMMFAVWQHADRAKAAADRAAAAKVADARAKLAALDPATEAADYAFACDRAESVDAAAVAGVLASRCAAAHFAVAKNCLGSGHSVSTNPGIACARAAFNAARKEGEGGDAFNQFGHDLDRIELKMVRRKYAETLRNRFLDNGLDVGVRVSGEDAEKITLSFVAFNEVWARRMSQDGLLEELQVIGFKRVDLTDGYDYGVHWDLTRPAAQQ
jgi:hypothetical protein